MKKMLLLVLVLFFCTSLVIAQQTDTTQSAPQQTTQKPKKKSAAQSKVYYGGELGISFGSFFRFRVAPMVGYKFTPELSGGVKIGYEYIKDKRYSETVTSHNYGGSVFTRYRFVPQLYAHGEFAYISYKYSVAGFESEREWVPFLFLGAGYVQRISKKAWAFVEVLFDVLQDDKSPYKDWEPFVSVGVSVGF